MNKNLTFLILLTRHKIILKMQLELKGSGSAYQEFSDWFKEVESDIQVTYNL